jgi:Na+-transporting NADH:ubiquinone oxidoreductase subunit NqrD
VIREVVGFGTLLNMRIAPPRFEPWVVVSMAQGAWFLLAVFYWVFRRAARLQPAEQE